VTVREVHGLTPEIKTLFERSFRIPAPDFPRHFVAMVDTKQGERLGGYVHYVEYEKGVFLIGGLCVDSRVYRLLPADHRAHIASHGSLCRWLSDESIAALGPKRAVFAYTGDTSTRRDAFALGFAETPSPHILVQWHGEPEATREALIRRIEARAPF
jgi:hypothetical protein